MSVTINGTNGLTFNDASTQTTAATGFGFKNRLINGNMVIDQRNAGASVTPANLAYTLDRWKAEISTSSKFTVQQSSTAPAGFNNSLLITSSSAYTVGAADYFAICQAIEGFNIADLGFGAAGAQTITVSFWVRSSVTGTYSAVLVNQNDTRVYPFTYTINSANTFEQKSVTIAGDTTGTWLSTNGAGIRINFYIGLGTNFQGSVNSWNNGTVYGSSGTTNLVSTNGATFYITGVQLEKGSTATSFDYRPYGTELALCQRYYQILQNASGGRAETATFLNMPFRTLCTMRTAPSGAIVGTIVVRDLSGTTTRTATTPGSLNLSIANDTGGYLEFGASSWSPGNYTVGNLCALACSTGINGIALSSEL